MNRHIKIKKCVYIGGKYLHTSRTAAKAWAYYCVANIRHKLAIRDQKRYNERFGIVDAAFKDGNAARHYWKWFESREEKAYRRSEKIFRKFFKS